MPPLSYASLKATYGSRCASKCQLHVPPMIGVYESSATVPSALTGKNRAPGMPGTIGGSGG